MKYRFKIWLLLWTVLLGIASPHVFAEKASQEKMDDSLRSWCGRKNVDAEKKVAELLAQGANPNASTSTAIRR